MLRLVLLEDGKRQELTRGSLKEVVRYLQENETVINWVRDEDTTAALPELNNIETIRDLRKELNKVDLGWWTLGVEEIIEA